MLGFSVDQMLEIELYEIEFPIVVRVHDGKFVIAVYAQTILKIFELILRLKFQHNFFSRIIMIYFRRKKVNCFCFKNKKILFSHFLLCYKTAII